MSFTFILLASFKISLVIFIIKSFVNDFINIVNSSPPIRATMSLSCVLCNSIFDTATKTSFPSKCPKVSFTVLKSSISITNRASLFLESELHRYSSIRFCDTL